MAAGGDHGRSTVPGAFYLVRPTRPGGSVTPTPSSWRQQFEISTKTAQRSIDHFRDRLLAPLEYELSRKGYYYTDPTFQLPVMRISQEELLALLISRKLITEASAGSLGDELGHISQRLGSLLAANLPGRARPEEAFSFRWKTISPTDPLTFKIVTSALLQGKLLTFCYYSPTSSDCTMRTVEPHHMVNYMGNWHLIAFCRLRNDWRDFVLGRMTLCQVEGETLPDPPQGGVGAVPQRHLRHLPEQGELQRGAPLHPGAVPLDQARGLARSAAARRSRKTAPCCSPSRPPTKRRS